MLSTVVATILFWSSATVATILTAAVSIICYPFVDQKTFARIFECVAGWFIMAIMSIFRIWSVRVINRSGLTLTSNQRYVIAANHLSFIDSLVAIRLPFKKKFIMARKFSNIPIFGWLCRTAGHVMVDKYDTSTTRPAVTAALETMKDGCSFMIYPEGQRAKPEEGVLPFKTGTFRLASQTSTQILPVTLIGTDKALAMGGLAHPAEILLIIDTPIIVGPTWANIKDSMIQCKSIIQTNVEHYNS